MIGSKENHVQAVDNGNVANLRALAPMTDRRPDNNVGDRKGNGAEEDPGTVHTPPGAAFINDNANNRIVDCIPQLRKGHDGIRQESHQERSDHTVGNGVEIVAHAENGLGSHAQPLLTDFLYALMLRVFHACFPPPLFMSWGTTRNI